MTAGIRFVTTSFGPGSMVRFKDRKSSPWTYAIYRGVQGDGVKVTAYTFSHLPLGPITLSMAFWPEFIETAVAKIGSYRD